MVRALGKSKTNSVATPPYLLKSIKDEFGTFFDPCPFNPAFDKKLHVDGLSIPWKKVNYCNPPYNSAKAWVHKAKKEQDRGNTTILLLKLSTLGTQYMKSVATTAELRIFSHALTFPGYNGFARFTNVFLIFHADKRLGGTVTFVRHLPQDDHA